MGHKLFQRSNGYWYIYIRRGKKIALKTKDEHLAKKAFKEFEEDFLKEKLVQLEKEQLTLLKDFMLEYLGDGDKIVGIRTPTVGKKTYKADKLAANKFYQWYGNKPMVGITRKKMQEYRSHLLTLKLRPNTVNNYIRHLRFAIKQALSWNYIKDKDVLLEFRQVKVPPGQIVFLDETEVKHLIDVAQKSKYEEMRSIVPVVICTGMPRQNICCQLHISKEHFLYIRTKTQKPIHVPIIDLLKPYIGHLKTGINLLSKCHPDTIGHRFKEIAREAGLGHVSIHKMRHTFATLLLKAGVDIATVSELLGHASIEITKKYYAHIVPGLKVQAMQKFNDMLK